MSCGCDDCGARRPQPMTTMDFDREVPIVEKTNNTDPSLGRLLRSFAEWMSDQADRRAR